MKSPSLQQAATTVNVLIVEDETSLQDRALGIVQELCPADWQADTRVFPSAEMAITQINAGFSPRLVILDHKLNGTTTGLDVYRCLVEKRLPCTVVLSSGRLTETHHGKHVYKMYLDLGKQTADMDFGLRLQVVERNQEILKRKVSEFFKAAAAKTWAAINTAMRPEVVAQSQEMQQLCAILDEFILAHQQGRKNILVLHGEDGSGRCFLAQQVVQQTTPTAAKEGIRSECAKSPASYMKMLLALKPDQRKTCFVYPSSASSKNEIFSGIVVHSRLGDFAGQGVETLLDLAVKNPSVQLIWLFLPREWELFSNTITNSLPLSLTVAKIPQLKERAADIDGLCRIFLAEEAKGKGASLTLQSTALAELKRNLPGSTSELWRQIRDVANRIRATGAGQITVTDLFPSGSKVSLGAERPFGMTEVMYQGLVSLLEKTARAGGHTETRGLTMTILKDVELELAEWYLASAYASARRYWNTSDANKWGTFCGVKFAGMCKSVKTKFGRSLRQGAAGKAAVHHSYLNKLVDDSGVHQPKPSET